MASARHELFGSQVQKKTGIYPGSGRSKLFTGDVLTVETSFSLPIAISRPERSCRNAKSFYFGKASGMGSFRYISGGIESLRKTDPTKVVMSGLWIAGSDQMRSDGFSWHVVLRLAERALWSSGSRSRKGNRKDSQLFLLSVRTWLFAAPDAPQAMVRSSYSRYPR